MKFLRNSLKVLLLSAVCPFYASAAVITWGTAQDITDDSDIPAAFASSVHSAYNIGDGGGAAPVTINGITFGAGTPAGGSSGPYFCTASAGLSTDYTTLMNYGAYGNGNATFSGLTAGNVYTLQVWANDSRSLASTRITELSAGNSVALDQNVAGVANGLGQYVFGTFTADSTTQTMHITGGATWNAAVVYNGAVPEPSSVGLIGLVSIGSLMARRMILRRR